MHTTGTLTPDEVRAAGANPLAANIITRGERELIDDSVLSIEEFAALREFREHEEYFQRRGISWPSYLSTWRADRRGSRR